VRKAGKMATNQKFSQHSRGRKANFQQKRHHNRNLAWKRNHGNDAQGHNSRETSKDVNAELST
ncbi:hypothetical protein CCACVL1_00696, partial [Corchorus capsularis]